MAVSVQPRVPFFIKDTGIVSPAWVKWLNEVRAEVNAGSTDKADKVGGAPDGKLAKLDSSGNLAAVSDLTPYVGSLDHSINDDGDGSLSFQHVYATVGLLASTTVNGQTTTKQTVFTVPSGKTMIVHACYFRGLSASLAGLTDMDIGGDAAASDWLQQITLAGLTSSTHCGYVVQPEQAAGPPIVPVQKIIYSAATAFGIKINTGSTGAATFVVDLIGYLY